MEQSLLETVSTVNIQSILYFASFALLLIGIYAITQSHHFIRIILGLTLLNAGVNLLLITIGYQPDSVAPILKDGVIPVSMVDPIPQALVLTAIVIGVGIQALALAMVIRVRQTCGSLDTQEVYKVLSNAIQDNSIKANGTITSPAPSSHKENEAIS